MARPALAVATLALVAFSSSVPLRAQDDPVVAKVNGTEIHQSDLALADEEVGAQQTAQMTPEAKRDYLVAFLTDMNLVAKAAEAKKVGDSADFKRRLSYARNKLLMETYLQSEAKAAVTEQAMRKVYDEAIGQMKKEPEVRARHILVETEDEAKAVIAELKKGGDFAELAKTKSKDPGSADGGDLGYFTKDQMVPEFSEVAFKMYPGQVSNPVKTQFGWHIIKVEDKRTRAMPEFDKVKDQIATYVARKAQTEFIAHLRETAKVERLDRPATPPAAAPATPPAAAPAPAAPAESVPKQ
jgi:peptidyl-prolyl cis-trans isomerase C